MDYKEKYENALERARELKNKLEKNCSLATPTGIESIFPELAESEDERIRKDIISYLQHESQVKRFIGDIEYDKWVAWLEKKGEQKPTWSEDEERILNGLISSLARIGANTRTDSTSINYTFSREIDWLKSIKNRVQPQWKPTDEQMETLDLLYTDYVRCDDWDMANKINSLYNDLKKL